jgi:hypothetical protein
MNMPGKALRTWLVATVIGVATMLAIQGLFKNSDPLVFVPIAQAAALWVAWMIAWPLWFRSQPQRRFGPLGHALSMLLVAGGIAMIRVVFRLG